MVQAQENTIVVSPQWLNQQLQDPTVVVLQPAFMRLDHVREHIKGARFLWPDWLAFNSRREVLILLIRKSLSRSCVIWVSTRFKDYSLPQFWRCFGNSQMFLTLEYLGLKGRVYF